MLNIFVGGSTVNDNFIVGPSIGNLPNSLASYWGQDPNNFDIIHIEKSGKVSWKFPHYGRKDIVVVYAPSQYLETDLENVPFCLENAISMIREQLGHDQINIYGHSNGGNIVTRWIETYNPDYIHNICTVSTPYNGKAVSVDQTGFLKEAIANKDKIRYSGQADIIVARTSDQNTYPDSIPSDGVVSYDSASCGLLIYGSDKISVVDGYDHNTAQASPLVSNLISKWF